MGGVGHLEVELIEFSRGTVGAGVFVAEAGRDLIIAIDAGNHQELLEHLRRLGQGIEFAFMFAAGDEEVPCAFGGGGGQDGRLHVGEAVFFHFFAQEGDEVGAKFDALGHFGVAEIEEAVFETGFLLDVEGIGRLEGQHIVNRTEDFHCRRAHLDFAGGDASVDGFGSALFDDARKRNAGFFLETGDHIGIDDDLRDAVTVAEVDKNDSAVVADGIDPPAKGNLFADVGDAEFAAGVSSQSRFEVHSFLAVHSSRSKDRSDLTIIVLII